MLELEPTNVIWATRECENSNRKNCKYLRLKMKCIHTDNPDCNSENSCRKYLCPIRVV